MRRQEVQVEAKENQPVKMGVWQRTFDEISVNCCETRESLAGWKKSWLGSVGALVLG